MKNRTLPLLWRIFDILEGMDVQELLEVLIWLSQRKGGNK